MDRPHCLNFTIFLTGKAEGPLTIEAITRKALANSLVVENLEKNKKRMVPLTHNSEGMPLTTQIQGIAEVAFLYARRRL